MKTIFNIRTTGALLWCFVMQIAPGTSGLHAARPAEPVKAAKPSQPAQVSHYAPKARTVILVYLDGGPSQTDTFDPKPKAGKDYCGNYRKPIDTNVPGIQIGEKLPMLAAIADKYAIIRSMTHGSGAHETGHYLMITGDMSKGPVVYPAFGAVIAYEMRDKYNRDIPPYVSVVQASSRFNEAGFLGPQYKSFDTGGAPESSFYSVEGIVNKGVTDEELRSRRELLYKLDAMAQNVPQTEEVKEIDRFRDKTYSLILGPSREVFDLSKESDSVRNRYGRTRFGQSCLVARRLAEYGVPMINVRFTGWDTHKEHFARMDERLADLDRGLSALLEDLDSRGLLDSTIVLCGGEFGRTPRIMWEPPWNGGRGHFGAAFSYLVAGGGFKGGVVVGETDPKGEKVVSRPVYPCDLIGSVYTLMGIDPHGTLPHPRLGDIPMLPTLGRENLSGGILTEIINSK